MIDKTILIAVVPMALATFLYIAQVVGYVVMLNRPGVALAFFGYALANVGLIWDAIQAGVWK